MHKYRLQNIRRKAQGLSLNYVIVGIIAVVILVVIVLIFTQGLRDVPEETAIVANSASFCKCINDFAHQNIRRVVFCNSDFVTVDVISTNLETAISSCKGFQNLNIDCSSSSNLVVVNKEQLVELNQRCFN